MGLRLRDALNKNGDNINVSLENKQMELESAMSVEDKKLLEEIKVSTPSGFRSLKPCS